MGALIRIGFIPLFFLLACVPDNSVDLASESIKGQLVFCNPFNKGGFEGVLSIQTSNGDYSYEADSAVLTFYKVPTAFRHQRTSFIQIFSIIHAGGQMKKNKAPIDIQVFNRVNDNYSRVTKYIDHNFIQEESSDDVDLFIFNHGFIIPSTGGWQSIQIGLFNTFDQEIESVQVLIPPFSANPYTFRDENTQNPQIAPLHPFYSLIQSTTPEDTNIFLSKAEQACNDLQ